MCSLYLKIKKNKKKTKKPDNGWYMLIITCEKCGREYIIEDENKKPFICSCGENFWNEEFFKKVKKGL